MKFRSAFKPLPLNPVDPSKGGEEVMSDRARTFFVSLQALFVGVGAGIHIGYYAGSAGANPSIVVVGYLCYIVAFGMLATRALLEQSREPPRHS